MDEPWTGWSCRNSMGGRRSEIEAGDPVELERRAVDGLELQK